MAKKVLTQIKLQAVGGQATAVVLGFVVIAGAFLGVADWLATKLVDFII